MFIKGEASLKSQVIFGKDNSENYVQLYKNKTAPTIDVLYKKVKKISTGTHYEIPCSRNTL